MNAGEAQQMADAAKANGVEFVIGFQHRYEPKSKLLRDMIQAGEFGDIPLCTRTGTAPTRYSQLGCLWSQGVAGWRSHD